MTAREELRAWLAGFGSRELEQTLHNRADVLWGAPIRDLDDLADRLVHPTSVAAVVGDLPAPALQVLELLAATGAGASRERAAAVLDAGATGSDVAAHRVHVGRSLAVLEGAALVWPAEDGRLVLNPGVNAVIPFPLGFGRPAEALLADVSTAELKRVLARWGQPLPARKAEAVEAVRTYLADVVRVRRLVGGAPEAVSRVLVFRAQETAQRALADRIGVAGAGAYGYHDYTRDPAAYAAYRAAVAWASENGLAFSPYSPFSGQVELPSEAVLALVDADFRAPFTPVSPSVATAPVNDQQVQASASGALTEFLATVMATLEMAARAPLAGLKSGGVGARELARVAKRLGTGVGDVRLALELALWLRLLHRTSAGAVGTSPAFDEWRRRDPDRRAADLLTTWYGLDYVPTLDRDDDGRTLPSLARSGGPDRARTVRFLALTHLEELDEGTGVTAVDTLADRIAWRLPVLMADGAALDLRATWAEAERLGVVAHGRLTSAGAALVVADAPGLVRALTPMVPGVETRALFGSDLTVIVPGSPDPAVVDLLDALAVREGRGAASTWRVTPESVRGALDAGYDAAGLAAGLRELTDVDLPQALEYLIRDVGRRHGHLQVQPAGAVVRSDDDALLAEVVVHRGLRRLGLRQVAPTVLVFAAPVDEVVAALRVAGYLPLALGVDGDPVVTLRAVPRPAPRPAHTPGPGGGTDLGSAADVDGGFDVPAGVADDVDVAVQQWAEEFASETAGASGAQALFEESLAEVAARLVAGTPPAEADDTSRLEYVIRATAPRLSAAEARQLAYAITYGEPVEIHYRSSASGQLTVRVVSELALERDLLVGWCHLRRDERTFAVANIVAVAAAPPADQPT